MLNSHFGVGTNQVSISWYLSPWLVKTGRFCTAHVLAQLSCVRLPVTEPL